VKNWNSNIHTKKLEFPIHTYRMLLRHTLKKLNKYTLKYACTYTHAHKERVISHLFFEMNNEKIYFDEV
jgi:hypothetical protein